MQAVLNVDDVRAVEGRLVQAGVSLAELMRRAGAAAASEALSMGEVQRVVVFCGYGNNGGDGWVAAEELLHKGVRVSVVTPLAPNDLKSELARQAARHAAAAGVYALISPQRDEITELLLDADVIIDCLLGTGFHGDPAAPFDAWIDYINSSGVRVLAVDVPSGLSAQTGHAPGGCVVADETVTMLALKPGLLSDEGRDVCGGIVVAPLARQTERLAAEAEPLAWRTDLADYQPVVSVPSAAVDKFSRGSVLVVGGSTRFPGAPMMAARAAARAGAGYVTLAVPQIIAPIVQTQMLEIPVVGLPCEQDGTFSPRAAQIVAKLAAKRDAVLVGPGMRATSGTCAVVSALLEEPCRLVIDADGINCIARLTNNSIDEYPEILRRSSPLVLTPHRGELARLLGLGTDQIDSLASMLEAARRVVWAVGGSELCIVAKGNASACTSVDKVLLPKPGPVALATAGSGDVLGGITAALMTRTDLALDELPLVSALACEIHAYAGMLAAQRFGSRGVMAGDIIDCVGLAVDAAEERIMLADANYE
jgi:NAD(P)H-hydrate epimerase